MGAREHGETKPELLHWIDYERPSMEHHSLRAFEISVGFMCDLVCRAPDECVHSKQRINGYCGGFAYITPIPRAFRGREDDGGSHVVLLAKNKIFLPPYIYMYNNTTAISIFGIDFWSAASPFVVSASY